MPWSKMKLAIAKILKEEGFIGNYEVLRGKPGRMIKIYLKYMDKKQPAILGSEADKQAWTQSLCPEVRNPPSLWRIGYCHPLYP